jgi:hypothetical protein
MIDSETSDVCRGRTGLSSRKPRNECARRPSGEDMIQLNPRLQRLARAATCRGLRQRVREDHCHWLLGLHRHLFPSCSAVSTLSSCLIITIALALDEGIIRRIDRKSPQGETIYADMRVISGQKRWPGRRSHCQLKMRPDADNPVERYHQL